MKVNTNQSIIPLAVCLSNDNYTHAGNAHIVSVSKRSNC